jgi:EAL domain-containing protein (putative c-di-GMP-specific phosphodiesterase class I)
MVFMGTAGRALANSEYARERSGVRFELQAIADAADLSVYGYEFLYRDKVRPTSAAGWAKVDQGVLKYLGKITLGLDRPCFINLSHESFMAISEAQFLEASEKNELRFELSEAVAEGALFEQVCNKVNRLIGRGMHFAIDDFGAGLDGSRRLYALDQVAVIKVDRDLLISAAGRSNAAKMLAASVASWKVAGIQTVAEGVETAELLAFAQGLGFDLVQGWHVDTLAPPEQAFISRSFFDHFCSVLCT